MKNGKKEVKEAAALKYSPDTDRAPEIIALGKGVVAGKILEKARENSVPVYQDENLAHILNNLNLGDEIPAELYGIVAEIMVFVSNMDKEYGEKNERSRRK